MNKDVINNLRRDDSIDEEVLETLLKMHGSSKIDAQSIVDKVYKDDRAEAISKKEMHILGDLIRYTSKSVVLDSRDWFEFVTDLLSYAAFALVMGVFFWMIFDSQSRATIDFGLDPIMVVFISAAIVFFVALLEGSQIAIVNISDKDISSAADTYPIAFDIQKATRTKEAVQDYLIGRQLLVVALVIVFSLLTSFPNIGNSYRNVEIPGVVDLVAFKLGLVNALILLWLGQLVPQLLASRAPQSVLNIRLVKYVVYLCIYLSRLKIAKPSSLVVDLADIKEHAPPSSEYDVFVKNVDMYRHYLDRYSVTINFDGDSNASIESRRKFLFIGSVSRIIRRTLGIYGRIDKYRLDDIFAHRDDGTEFRMVDTGSKAEPERTGEMTYFSHLLEPQTSIFHSGDEMEMTDHFEVSDVEQLDVRVDRPIRVLFIKCVMPDSLLDLGNVKIPDLKIEIAQLDRSTEEYEMEKEINIVPERKDGYVVATYAYLFPILDSSISISWEVEK